MKGDCLSCKKVGSCSATSVEAVLSSFTCVLFESVPEPVYRARVTMMDQYGDEAAVRAMLSQAPKNEGEE